MQACFIEQQKQNVRRDSGNNPWQRTGNNHAVVISTSLDLSVAILVCPVSSLTGGVP